MSFPSLLIPYTSSSSREPSEAKGREIALEGAQVSGTTLPKGPSHPSGIERSALLELGQDAR